MCIKAIKLMIKDSVSGQILGCEMDDEDVNAAIHDWLTKHGYADNAEIDFVIDEVTVW